MRVLRTTLLAATALALALPALAQPAPGTGQGGRERGMRGPDAMFQRIDADKDGRVVWAEAWGFVLQRFNEADRDRDGGLTLVEMQAMHAQMMGGRPEGGRAERPGREGARGADHGPMAAMMFRAIDADRDGRVTLVELRPMAEARFRALDANGDNSVSREEVPQRHHRGPRADRATPDGQAPATPR